MTWRGRFFIGLFLFASLDLVAGEHDFHVIYSNNEGLVGMQIRSCSQDGYGRIWVGSGSGVYFYDGNKFRALDDNDYMQECTKMTFAVRCDSNGKTWIASSSGAGFYDTVTGAFTTVNGFNSEPARDLDEDPEGKVWITSHSGIWSYDFDSRSTVRVIPQPDYHPEMSFFASDGTGFFILSEEGSIIRHEMDTRRNFEIYPPKDGSRAVCICESDHGQINAALESGLILRIDGKTGQESDHFDIKTMIRNTRILSLMEKDGVLWVGTASGLLTYDWATGHVDDQTGVEEKEFTLSGQTIREIFEDNDGNVWIGTANGGLRVWMNYGGDFNRFIPDGEAHSLSGTSIRALCADRQGFVWTGSEEGHVCKLNPSSGEFEDFSERTGIRYGTVITSIKEIDGMLWIATYGDGLIEFDPVAGKTVLKCNGPTSRFFALTVDHSGHIRAGTDIGVFAVNKATGGLVMENSRLAFPVHSLTGDAFGRIWLGTYGHGIMYWEPGNPVYVPLSYADSDDNLLPSNYINYLFTDSDNSLWICSEGSGITRIRFSISGEIVDADRIDRQSGLPSNDVKSAFEAPDGHIWVMTSDGMAELDQVSMCVLDVYMQSDGVIGKFFDPAACLMTESGRAYAGTNRGLLSFSPTSMGKLFGRKPVHINGIRTGTSGKSETVTRETSLTREMLRIPWKDASMLTVAYSSYDYANPNSELFDCELKRYRFSSTITTGDFSASYAGLRPGHYTFTVSPSGSSDPHTSDSMRFFLVPPWYLSVSARLIYVLALVLAVALLIRRNKQERKRLARFKEAQANMQNLHSQMGFLTNVTHEIRTPVTMMTILMDRIFKKKDNDQDEDMASMRSNMNRLLELCDQMLDYRKIENEQIKLNLDDESLNGIIQTVVESFRPAAEARGMGFVVSLPPKSILARCDKNAVESILGNLLSNAVKYGLSRIGLELTRSEKDAIVFVESDGERIPKDESELIFNAFYQSNPQRSTGTGIGLTYSRALANMQNGSLFLDEKSEDTNRFVFTLPLSIQGESVQERPATSPVEDSKGDETVEGGMPLILVVEDNDGLRRVILDELNDEYRTVGASNGAEALDIIKKENVDLVISDIMMPVMDGCELCNTIKSDLRTSHIVVILLTAAIGTTNHIKSLRAGADGYIEKPFRMELLRENVHNLFRNREIRNEQFASSPLSHFRCASYSSVEQDFMDALNNYIFEHISDTEMSADRLASALNTTRKILAHKISANTGLTVNEYVRTCRLKKAAELLAKQKYRINEVGYLVGYSTPSYFTKHFTAQFGMKPSDFVRTL